MPPLKGEVPRRGGRVRFSITGAIFAESAMSGSRPQRPTPPAYMHIGLSDGKEKQGVVCSLPDTLILVCANLGRSLINSVKEGVFFFFDIGINIFIVSNSLSFTELLIDVGFMK